jgi:hypothetical protein
VDACCGGDYGEFAPLPAKKARRSLYAMPRALPPADPHPSTFGLNELTTGLVLRFVDDNELHMCGCVCKLLERAVDEARDEKPPEDHPNERPKLRARRARRERPPFHVDLAHGDDDGGDGTRRRPLRTTEKVKFLSHLYTGDQPGYVGEVVVHCASSGCETRACAADSCGDAVCVNHGSGVGEILIEDGWLWGRRVRFEPSTCAHAEGCPVAYCTVHQSSRLGKCDICHSFGSADVYCAAHRTRCQGARWRHDTGRIPRMKRWWTQRGSAAGEDPEFGALHACSYTCCNACMAKHKCGEPADLEDAVESDGDY